MVGCWWTIIGTVGAVVCATRCLMGADIPRYSVMWSRGEWHSVYRPAALSVGRSHSVDIGGEDADVRDQYIFVHPDIAVWFYKKPLLFCPS